jgi:hypothetical protein
MKISAMTIVFNTESILPKNMLKLCIENILPFVDEYIIVEGATKASYGHPFDGDTSFFTNDGKSNDGTIEVLQDLEKTYDKIKVIYSKGFWPGKTFMCNAASHMAQGEYILQKDADEFYHHSDMEKIIDLLKKHNPGQVDFYANHFVFGFDSCIDETNGKKWGNDIPWRRIFKHTPGKSYWMSHEPPVYNNQGFPTYQWNNNISRDRTLSMGIKMFHYSYVVESQFRFKSKFFKNPEYDMVWDRYKDIGVKNIFGIEPKKFFGDHPEIIKQNYKV